MSGITRNCYGFFAWVIAQNSRKSSIVGQSSAILNETHDLQNLELHNNTKEVPFDLDIPQSLNSLYFVGCKIGLGAKIKATNPSVDIMNC